MSAVTIRLFTDPACPPVPAWTRLRWLYGDQIAWEIRMCVVRERRLRPWPHEPGSDATVHACRAVVAAGLRWPDRQEALLRRLQMLSAAGEPLDDSDTLEIAAARAGLPVAEIAAYCADPEVEAALRAAVAAARDACPFCEIVAGDARFGVDEADLATLAPSLERRPDPASVEEVLAWTGIPLATAEVAAVCGRGIPDVRAELARVARFEPAGDDGYWFG